MSDQYFADEDIPPSYLTMARIEANLYEEWSKKNIYTNDIGHTMIRARSAFKDGFFAGFQARFFNTEEK